MKRATKIISLLLLLTTLTSLIPLNTVSVSAATATSEDGGFYMNYGAEVRVDDKKGMRFSANITSAQLEIWKAEGTLTFGMVMLPFDYIDTYGEPTAENLFGTSAVYSFDIGADAPYIRDLAATELCKSQNAEIYTFKASAEDLADSEIDTYFTARAYVKITDGSSVKYYMADYNASGVLNNTRSVRSLARSAYNNHINTAGGVYDSDIVALLEDLINNAPEDTAPEVKISDIAVYETYDFSTMKDVHSTSGNTPLAWRGSSESDRANIYAGYELVTLYRQITGKELSVTYVSSVSELDSTKKYFILGEELALDAGLDQGGITADNGHKLVKYDGNIYLYGKSGYGTVNAVYEFLRQAFGIEFYSDTVFEVQDTVYRMSEITDTVFNPSVDYNWSIDGVLFIGDAINYTYQFRLGFVNYWQILGGNIHGFETVFPEDTYPDYYASNGVLDLNSAGDFNTENEMVKIVADWIYDLAMTSNSSGALPNKTVYIFGPQDERVWSNSSASAANLEKYGANSAEYILFMNAVTERLDRMYQDLREIEVLMLSYNKVLDAPTYHLDELEFYSGDTASLKVMYAPIEMNMNDSADSTVKDYYGGTPVHYFEQYEKWCDLAGEDNVYVWRYSAIFSDYLLPLNAIEHIGEHYKEYVGEDNYIKHLMDQGASGAGDCSVMSNFAALMAYLKGQLGRNASSDVDTLVSKFCKAYYGAEAGVYIEQLILAEREHLNDLKEAASSSSLFSYRDPSGCHYIGSGSSLYSVKKFWGEDITNDGGAMIKRWYSYIELALANTDDEAEQARIKVEGIAIRYLSLRIFGTGVYDGDTLTLVEEDALALGVGRIAEGKLTSKLDGV